MYKKNKKKWFMAMRERQKIHQKNYFFKNKNVQKKLSFTKSNFQRIMFSLIYKNFHFCYCNFFLQNLVQKTAIVPVL